MSEDETAARLAVHEAVCAERWKQASDRRAAGASSRPSDGQILLHDPFVGAQIGRGTGIADLPFLQDINPVGKRQDEFKVLFGQDDGQAGRLQLRHLLPNLLDDQRRLS